METPLLIVITVKEFIHEPIPNTRNKAILHDEAFAERNVVFITLLHPKLLLSIVI